MYSKIILSVQIIITFSVLSFCGSQLLKDKLDPNDKGLYLAFAGNIIGIWMSTPGTNRPQSVGQLNIDSKIESQIDGNKQ
ncbi:hypothetical protein Cri9333_1739 [Crinalium epipsammum PCC 9333]|uniref:Uncharacterized protein n=1 Tax=Crinalium epipsammum PCC 9333 TaxID=1173022 RepID=K9VYK9_9CYAN|nr:hypothetical protein Cri9333_1739 [Crinalium epipsammum PCC 9333]